MANNPPIRVDARSLYPSPGTGPADAGIAHNGGYLWYTRNNELLLYTSANSQRKAVWSFNNDEKQPANIACVIEWRSPASLCLLVAIHLSSHTSQLRLLDLTTTRTTHVLTIARHLITTMAHITRHADETQQQQPQQHILAPIIALGTRRGHVLVVDMNAGPDQEPRTGTDPRTHISHIITAVVSLSLLDALAVGYANGAFQLWHAPTLRLIYSSVQTESSSSHSSSTQRLLQAPVTHFLYQALPDDDQYAYLWVARGTHSTSTSPQPASVMYYTMQFTPSTDSSACHTITKFRHLSRSDVEVLGQTSASPTTGDIMSCDYMYDVAQARRERYLQAEDLHDDFDVRQARAAFVWAADAPVGEPRLVHIVVVDLSRNRNPEYPASFVQRYVSSASRSSEPGPVPSPMAVWIDPSSVSLFAPARPLLVGSADWTGPGMFTAPSFNMMCLSRRLPEDDHLMVARLVFQGVQQRVLTSLTDMGPQAIASPQTPYKYCMAMGMIVQEEDWPPMTSAGEDEQVDQLRRHVLNVCLKYNLVPLIVRYASSSPDPSAVRRVGAWAWATASKLKTLAEQRCRVVYNSSLGSLSDSERNKLLWELDETLLRANSTRDIFHALRKTQAGAKIQDLEPKGTAIQGLGHQIDSLTWFVRAGLLPQRQDASSALFAMMGRWYIQRRSIRAQKYNRNAWVVSPRMKPQRVPEEEAKAGALFIDWLVDSVGLGGDGGPPRPGHAPGFVYPPSDMRAVMDVLAGDPGLFSRKQLVVFYFLMDLAHFKRLGGRSETGIDAGDASLSVRYARAFSVPLAQQRLVEGYWLLDTLADEYHDEPSASTTARLNEALNRLAESSTVKYPWTEKVLRTLYDYGGTGHALRWLQTGAAKAQPVPHDIPLHVSVLSSNGLLHDALKLVRTTLAHQGTSDAQVQQMESLLFHMFYASEESGRVDALMNLPYDTLEDQCFVYYLATTIFTPSTPPTANRRSHATLLVLYLINKGRVRDAVWFYDRFQSGRSGDRSHPEEDMLMRRLVDNYRVAGPAPGLAYTSATSSRQGPSTTQAALLIARRAPRSSFAGLSSTILARDTLPRSDIYGDPSDFPRAVPLPRAPAIAAPGTVPIHVPAHVPPSPFRPVSPFVSSNKILTRTPATPIPSLPDSPMSSPASMGSPASPYAAPGPSGSASRSRPPVFASPPRACFSSFSGTQSLTSQPATPRSALKRTANSTAKKASVRFVEEEDTDKDDDDDEKVEGEEGEDRSTSRVVRSNLFAEEEPEEDEDEEDVVSAVPLRKRRKEEPESPVSSPEVQVTSNVEGLIEGDEDEDDEELVFETSSSSDGEDADESSDRASTDVDSPQREDEDEDEATTDDDDTRTPTRRRGIPQESESEDEVVSPSPSPPLRKHARAAPSEVIVLDDDDDDEEEEEETATGRRDEGQGHEYDDDAEMEDAGEFSEEDDYRHSPLGDEARSPSGSEGEEHQYYRPDGEEDEGEEEEEEEIEVYQENVDEDEANDHSRPSSSPRGAPIPPLDASFYRVPTPANPDEPQFNMSDKAAGVKRRKLMTYEEYEEYGLFVSDPEDKHDEEEEEQDMSQGEEGMASEGGEEDAASLSGSEDEEHGASGSEVDAPSHHSDDDGEDEDDAASRHVDDDDDDEEEDTISARDDGSSSDEGLSALYTAAARKRMEQRYKRSSHSEDEDMPNTRGEPYSQEDDDQDEDEGEEDSIDEEADLDDDDQWDDDGGWKAMPQQRRPANNNIDDAIVLSSDDEDDEHEDGRKHEDHESDGEDDKDEEDDGESEDQPEKGSPTLAAPSPPRGVHPLTHPTHRFYAETDSEGEENRDDRDEDERTDVNDHDSEDEQRSPAKHARVSDPSEEEEEDEEDEGDSEEGEQVDLSPSQDIVDSDSSSSSSSREGDDRGSETEEINLDPEDSDDEAIERLERDLSPSLHRRDIVSDAEEDAEPVVDKELPASPRPLAPSTDDDEDLEGDDDDAEAVSEELPFSSPPPSTPSPRRDDTMNDDDEDTEGEDATNEELYRDEEVVVNIRNTAAVKMQLEKAKKYLSTTVIQTIHPIIPPPSAPSPPPARTPSPPPSSHLPPPYSPSPSPARSRSPSPSPSTPQRSPTLSPHASPSPHSPVASPTNTNTTPGRRKRGRKPKIAPPVPLSTPSDEEDGETEDGEETAPRSNEEEEDGDEGDEEEHRERKKKRRGARKPLPTPSTPPRTSRLSSQLAKARIQSITKQ